MSFGDLSWGTYSFPEAAPKATWHVQIRHGRGLQLPLALGDAHLAIHSAMSRPLCPSSRPEVTKGGWAGVVRLLHVVWFGGSETPAHAWIVRALHGAIRGRQGSRGVSEGCGLWRREPSSTSCCDTRALGAIFSPC
jgi:hypothetical protein